MVEISECILSFLLGYGLGVVVFIWIPFLYKKSKSKF